MKKIPQLFWMLLPAILFFAAWQGIVAGNQRLEFLFASPLMVGKIALEELSQATIWSDVFVTLSEAVAGLFFGTVFGTAAGLLLWGNGRIDAVTRPYIVFIASIPIFALAPMTILWFGIGFLSKAVMAGFAVFFISLLQANEGAHAVARQYMGFARSIGSSNARIVWKIVIPGAVDWVIAGYKMNVGSALVGAFIAEFISSEAGLGYYILKASALYDVPRVLFGLGMLCLLGLGLTAFAWFVQSRRRV